MVGSNYGNHVPIIKDPLQKFFINIFQKIHYAKTFTDFYRIVALGVLFLEQCDLPERQDKNQVNKTAMKMRRK